MPVLEASEGGGWFGGFTPWDCVAPWEHPRSSSETSTSLQLLGSGRNGGRDYRSSLSTLGARIELAASFGRCREECLP